MRAKYIRRGLTAVALAAGLLGATAGTAAAATPADAERLTVYTYLQNGEIVGQKWFGCPGQEADDWGLKTPHRRISWLPCS